MVQPILRTQTPKKQRCSCLINLAFISYRKRLLIFLGLFIYYVIQLATYQGGVKHGEFHDSEANRKNLILTDVLMIITSIFAIFCGWIFRPFFEKNIVIFNAIIFGLTFSWLILAAPCIEDHSGYYFTNSFIVIILLSIDILAIIYNKNTDVIHLHHQKNNNTQLKLSSMANQPSFKTNFPFSISSSSYEQIDNTIDEEKGIHPGEEDIIYTGNLYSPEMLSNKGVCESFRVNLSSLPYPTGSLFRKDFRWDEFLQVQHLVDSSSCHIFTAFYENQPVVLKLIKADRISSSVALSEFEIEENLLSRIRHPHIIKLLGSGDQPRKFLVLEMLSGGTLSQSLGLRPESSQQLWMSQFSFSESLHLSLALAKALSYLHNEWSSYIHIIHRDLKPDNIGFTQNGEVKLFDFGLSTAVRGQRDANETYRMTGNTGTLRYMAPEVVLGRSYNQSVDVYSFAILSWQIVTGKVPFREMGKKAYFDRVVIGGQRLKLDKRWPKSFQTLLTQCWHEDKTQRPSFTKIVTELEQLVRIEDDRMFREQYTLSYRCSQSVKFWCFWFRPVTLVLLFIIFLLGLIILIQNDDTITGAALAGISTCGAYAILLSYLSSLYSWPNGRTPQTNIKLKKKEKGQRPNSLDLHIHQPQNESKRNNASGSIKDRDIESGIHDNDDEFHNIQFAPIVRRIRDRGESDLETMEPYAQAMKSNINYSFNPLSSLPPTTIPNSFPNSETPSMSSASDSSLQHYISPELRKEE